MNSIIRDSKMTPIKEPLQNRKDSLEELQQKQKRRFQPLKMSELMNLEFLEQKWLVENLIPMDSITMIAGYPTSFKTWLMLDLAVKISQGKKFLDHFDTEKMKVLFIDEENGERLLQTRFKKITELTNLDINFLSFRGFKLDKSDLIIDDCKKNQIGLVIMDSLIRIHNQKDENSSTEMAKLYDQFKKFKKENITVIFSHHNRKVGSNRPNSAEDIRGSSELFAFLDCGLSLKKRKGKNSVIEVEQTKLREQVERSPFQINIIDKDDLIEFEFAGDIKEVEKVSKIEQAKKNILSLLEVNQELYRQELMKKIKDNSEEKIGESSIKEALQQLVQDGQISSRTGSGSTQIYSLKKSVG